jgi:hypothetical protein
MRKRRDDIHETPDVTYIHNPEVAHEVSDVNIKGILQFTFGLLIFFLISLGLMKLMYNFFEQREARQEMKAPAGPMALTEKERLPQGPRLQAAPGFGDDLSLGEGKNLELQAPQAEYRILSARWQEVLDKGQKDPQTGAVIALPIEEAMKQLTQKGLPSRPTANGQKNYEQVMEMPSYSSSGRTMEKRKQ